MSTLKVPRLYFKGVSSWDPPTTNNNDQWPTFDFTNAELDWGYLASQTPPITRANVKKQFPIWAQTLREFDPGGGAPPYQQPPAEWNYYGGANIALNRSSPAGQTVITGGQTTYGGTIDTSDPVINAPINLYGDPFPGSTRPTSARMVDINPGAFWSTDFYLRGLTIGDASSPLLSGDIVPGTRMSSRFMNVQRNLNLDNGLEIAGVASIVMQTCLPNQRNNGNLRIDAGNSDLLALLDEMQEQPNVKGVMVRIVVYATLYFSREEFAGCNGLTEQYTRLTELWEEALKNNTTPIQNPAVSTIVGTVGPWMNEELVSVPGGRYLFAGTSLAVTNASKYSEDTPPQVPLGPTFAELNTAGGDLYLSLDLGSTIPEIDSTLEKANFGPIDVKLSGNSTPLFTLNPHDYSKPIYDLSAGILDVRLPDGFTADDFANGFLEFEAQGKVAASETTLSSSAITVQTDQRGVYVNQSESASFTLQVRQGGAIPTQPIKVLMQQYMPSPAPPSGGGSWILPSASQTIAVVFTDAPDNIVMIEPGGVGEIEVNIKAVRPGFPNIVFFPFMDGDPVPQPPAVIIPVYNEHVPNPPLTIASAFYNSVRVLPFDDGLPHAFVALWNATHDKNEAWNFIYYQIFYLYEVIYPVMKFIANLDLGDQQAVEQNIEMIHTLIATDMEENTMYMPVTRELSSGKRIVLNMYYNILTNNLQGDIEVPD